MSIKSGEVADINLNAGTWIILDIGFANDKKASCGLLIDNADPIELTFANAVEKISSTIRESSQPVNLVIEAPLSVAFSKLGNPTGRAIEKRGSKTRYWYVGLGCAVMVSAQYLISNIVPVCNNRDVRLFEGFVSFKPSGSISNHSEDVQMLKNVIINPEQNEDKIIAPAALKQQPTDSLQSAFLVLGHDLGIPPVIIG
jgi:hypothetical protein